MKKLLILFLFSTKMYCQDIDAVKTADTIYIYFDEKQSFPDLHLKKYDNGTQQTFLYTFPDAKYLKLATFAKDKDNRHERKCYLKRLALKMFTIDTIHKHGLGNMMKILNDRKKVIYLIDKDEKKRGKIYLRRAYCHTFPDVVE
jgi:hypothetical protein